MTPEEAVSAAFRGACTEMARGMTQERVEAYQAFLIQTSEYLDNAATALSDLCVARPTGTASQCEAMEMQAYFQMLQATVACIMALGHFPYLHRIDVGMIPEKLC